MDENNNLNYECEPVQEPAQEKQQPQYQQPPYPYPPYQQPYSYQPYSPYQPYPPQKPKKKKGTGLKIAALLVAVAILGSVGGALLTNAISSLNRETLPEEVMEEQTSGEQVAEKPVTEVPFEREKHQLPDRIGTNDTGKALSLTQVYELTVNSVVGINTEITTNAFGQEAVAASSGSGFILSEDGYIITNAHVVADATAIEVALFNGDSFDAKLFGSDSSFDIAVLKIEAKGLPAVTVGDSDKLKVGEAVVAIGNPLGELTFTMTNGILSAIDREINIDGNPQSMLQTNAAINSGNSGGPLFDMDGNVIGVTTAKYSGSTLTGTSIEGLGFAIPINEALKVAYDLAEYGYVKGQAYLGVTVATLDSKTAAYYSLPVGPRVESVTPGSCADKAGVQTGDIFIRFNGEDVENNSALLAALKRVKAGDTVNATLFRAGSEIEVTITLDERPSQQVLDAMVEEENKKNQEEEEYYYQFPDGFGN